MGIPITISYLEHWSYKDSSNRSWSSKFTLEANMRNLCSYHIYSAIRRGFHLSRMTTNNLISSM